MCDGPALELARGQQCVPINSFPPPPTSLGSLVTAVSAWKCSTFWICVMRAPCTGGKLFLFHIFNGDTGCPTIEFSLCFACFLGFPCSYRGSFYHFSTAQETRILKLTLISSLFQKLIKFKLAEPRKQAKQSENSIVGHPVFCFILFYPSISSLSP